VSHKGPDKHPKLIPSQAQKIAVKGGGIAIHSGGSGGRMKKYLGGASWDLVKTTAEPMNRLQKRHAKQEPLILKRKTRKLNLS